MTPVPAPAFTNQPSPGAAATAGAGSRASPLSRTGGPAAGVASSNPARHTMENQPGNAAGGAAAAGAKRKAPTAGNPFSRRKVTKA